MRTLLRMLQDHDPGFLRVIAELWGLDFPSGSVQEIAQTLAASMTQPEQFVEIIESLPDPARNLLHQISTEDGKAPYAQVDRNFGPLREMGPGRRDREQPWRQPASPLEIVWYRGLLGRAFADSPLGPQEFVYIPTDLLSLLEPNTDMLNKPLGHIAETPKLIREANTSAVDDATTLLAAFRKQPPARLPLPDERRSQLSRYLYQPQSIDLIVQLLVDQEFIDPKTLELEPELVGAFLEATSSQALLTLVGAWRDSAQWNDLAALPHLRFASADWPNDPRLSRTAVLDLLRTIPIGEWWNLGAFIEAVRDLKPGFQRPGGDFQSWYIQDGSGAFLNGIEHWESVDGAYLRYLIEGPIHWLGMSDLGRNQMGDPVSHFRLGAAWNALHSPETTLQIEEPESKIHVQPTGEVIVPRGADRVTRYQIARISAWQTPDRAGHHFRVTPGTLKQAKDQGLATRHILQLLHKAVEGELPPSFVRAVERWAQTGTEAQLKNMLLLRVEQPEILETLANHKSTSRYLSEILTPKTVIIREKDWPALRDASARLGLLIEPPEE